ncbi:hypothetical protein M3J09_005208 [Ascochyta lentis]
MCASTKAVTNGTSAMSSNKVAPGTRPSTPLREHCVLILTFNRLTFMTLEFNAHCEQAHVPMQQHFSHKHTAAIGTTIQCFRHHARLGRERPIGSFYPCQAMSPLLRS